MSDRPHERYSKVFFDENWLEQFVSDVLEIPIDVCYSKSMFRGDKSKRSLFYYALYKYAGLTITRISHRYSQPFDEVKRLVGQGAAGINVANADRLAAALWKYMPLRQFETYKD